MLILFTLLFPALLLGGALLMERVERPLRHEALGERVAQFLESARPEEVETYVSEGLAPALERYWSRRAPHRMKQREHQPV